jgi:uncharacterized protein DUF1207
MALPVHSLVTILLLLPVCWLGWSGVGNAGQQATQALPGLEDRDFVFGPTAQHSQVDDSATDETYFSADDVIVEDSDSDRPSLTVFAADDSNELSDRGSTSYSCATCRSFDNLDYQWQWMPEGLIYRQYLAGAKESRFRGIWNHQSDRGDYLDASLGGQVGLLRYGSRGDCRPVGWQLGIEGAGQVRLDLDESSDVDSADFRIGVPMTWGDEFSQLKFAYYHLSSHLGDEFLLKNPGYPRLNFSRDVLVFGYSIYPEPRLRLYAEVGYAMASDVSQPWETQFGIDYAPCGATGWRGAPFAAFNGHLREEVDFGGNFVFQTGWAWRRSPSSGQFRFGVEYYNGKSDQFAFYNNNERKVGLGIWYDY